MLSSWDKVLPYHHLLLGKGNSLLVGFLIYVHTCHTSFFFFPTQQPERPIKISVVLSLLIKVLHNFKIQWGLLPTSSATLGSMLPHHCLRSSHTGLSSVLSFHRAFAPTFHSALNIILYTPIHPSELTQFYIPVSNQQGQILLWAFIAL